MLTPETVITLDILNFSSLAVWNFLKHCRNALYLWKGSN